MMKQIKILLLGFFSVCILLGWIGAKPIEAPYLFIGQLCTGLYFSFFFLVMFVEKLDFYLLEWSIKRIYDQRLLYDFTRLGNNDDKKYHGF